MVKLLGVKQFFVNLDVLSKVKMPTLYRTAMKEVTTAVLRNSLQRTPIDTGLLRASARKETRANENGALGVVSYNTPYAIPVHEVLTSAHPIGEAKYLENAGKFITPLFPKMLQNRIRAVLGRRVMRDARIERMVDVD